MDREGGSTISYGGTGELKQSEKRFAQLTSLSRQLLEKIYGDQINHYEFFLKPDQAKRCTSIFNGFFSAALDSGAMDERTFTLNGKTEKAESTIAFRRGSFVDLVSKKAGIRFGKEGFSLGENLHFDLFDIKDFRQFDLARDANDNSYADILINRVIEASNEVLQELQLSQKAFVCRYGGDEFVIGGSGLTKEESEAMSSKIKERIRSLKGLYKDPDTNTIIEHPVELNESKQHVFDLEKSELSDIRRDVFLGYFKRGLLLNNDEIKKVIDRYMKPNENGTLVVDREGLYESIKPHRIYPDTISEEGADVLEKKIDYICKDNPQLRPIISLAQIIDKQESNRAGTNIHKRTEAILQFIETVIYDPLLKQNIYSFTDFVDHLKAQKFEMIRVVDVKFIKEINDMYNISEGDEAIKKVWNQINEGVLAKLDQKTRAKLRIGRRGGTFFIGMDAKDQLEEKELNQLQSLLLSEGSSVRIKLCDGETEIPLGLSKQITVKKEKIEEWNVFMSRIIKEVIGSAETDWYKKIIRLVQEEGGKIEYVLQSGSFECIRDPLKKKIFESFFSGKRKNERVASLQKAVAV